MSEITIESIDECLARVEVLETEIEKMLARAGNVLAGGAPIMPALRVRVPDENTPIHTFIRVIDGGGDAYFWRGNNTVSRSPFGEAFRVNTCGLFIDTLADLQFRLFLNAPKEYRWGAIDKDGEGYVYRNKPALNEEWWSKIEDALSVGLFPQYTDEWDKILVEREENK